MPLFHNWEYFDTTDIHDANNPRYCFTWVTPGIDIDPLLIEKGSHNGTFNLELRTGDLTKLNAGQALVWTQGEYSVIIVLERNQTEIREEDK